MLHVACGSVIRPKLHHPSRVPCPVYHRSLSVLSSLAEPLLTPEEANAILSTKSPDAFAGNSNTAAAEAATVAAGKEGCRREAEALAVLLAEDGPLLAGPISGDGDGDASSGIKKKATEAALTRLAARYLVRETVRGKIPDPVGNFHVRK